MSQTNGDMWHTASVDSSILIAIEGIDGAGKTTQADMLARSLEASGLEVLQSKEPTNGVHGKRIRESAATGRLPVDEELAAFIEDRREHLETKIQPALDAGKIVILDRYYYSTIAYQGARGKDVGELRRTMQEFAPIPDAVFLLDVDPSLGLFRIAHSRNETPNEFERLDALSAVRRVFNSLNDQNITRIDGSRSIEAVHGDILTEFIEGPLRTKRCAKEYGCDDPMHCTPRFTNQCEWWRLAQRLRSEVLEISRS